ncbi:unnamed protein product [Gongylonema pulchrum]|uniref:Myosin motor domain-containing protein n=1 Tax=Gongylonema pulchrum TaxID=637853 RepID=A0A183DSZ5_9BILA|nr:unnamed protein product [Gongylonema pulchrum]
MCGITSEAQEGAEKQAKQEHTSQIFTGMTLKYQCDSIDETFTTLLAASRLSRIRQCFYIRRYAIDETFTTLIASGRLSRIRQYFYIRRYGAVATKMHQQFQQRLTVLTEVTLKPNLVGLRLICGAGNAGVCSTTISESYAKYTHKRTHLTTFESAHGIALRHVRCVIGQQRGQRGQTDVKKQRDLIHLLMEHKITIF